jgi:porphobilinogen deaminase
VWTAERAVLEATNADCKKPIAIFALLQKGDILVTARAFSDDGRKMVEIVDSAHRHRADSIGRDIGHRLLEKIHAEGIW